LPEGGKAKIFFNGFPYYRLKDFACGENKVATDPPTGRQVAQ
jgi:hypothetical protein